MDPSERPGSRERIVLIGEIHGRDTKLVVELLDRFRDRTLAIEFPRSLQQVVDAFRVSGNPSELRAAMHEQPAKITDDALDLIRSRPAICVDVDELDASDPHAVREMQIAEAIHGIDGAVVAVLGSIHASKEPLTIGGRVIETVGFLLRDACVSINATQIPLPGYDDAPFVSMRGK